MSNKKLTKKDHFNALLAIPAVSANQTLVDFINHELELLAKKNSAEKKPTAKQIENDNLRDIIYNSMKPNQLYTITELIKNIPELKDTSNQKVSALIRPMIDVKIKRTVDKRQAFFSRIENKG